MCGIAGEIARGRAADLSAVAAMTDTMVPRGPDSSGVWSRENVAFGHRRLSIIDLSSHGHQPMHDSELGLTVAFNGCIYNYPELRRQLLGKGYRFFSHSDTEVILKGYREWGERVVDHLKGMFAFAVTELDSGRVVLARDRLGVKPLYWRMPTGAAPSGSPRRCPPWWRPAGWTPSSTRSRCTTICRFTPWSPRRAPSFAVSANWRPERSCASNPTAGVPKRPTGNRCSSARRSGPAGRRRTGGTPYWPRFAPRSNGGWSPTYPSGACCRAGWTPV